MLERSSTSAPSTWGGKQRIVREGGPRVGRNPKKLWLWQSVVSDSVEREYYAHSLSALRQEAGTRSVLRSIRLRSYRPNRRRAPIRTRTIAPTLSLGATLSVVIRLATSPERRAAVAPRSRGLDGNHWHRQVPPASGLYKGRTNLGRQPVFASSAAWPCGERTLQGRLRVRDGLTGGRRSLSTATSLSLTAKSSSTFTHHLIV
jgi:hypothetical protein